jgi:hypothetical protein
MPSVLLISKMPQPHEPVAWGFLEGALGKAGLQSAKR